MIAWILATIAVEAITEILVAASIFDKPRALIMMKDNFFSDLVSCGYCVSVWVALPIGLFLPGAITGVIVFDALLKVFVLHRLANFLHEVRVNWLQGLQFNVAIHKAEDKHEFDDLSSGGD